MRSGGGDEVVSDVRDEIVTALTSYMLVLIEEGAKRAVRFVRHCGRTVVQAQDVRRGLRIATIDRFWDIPDVHDRARRMHAELKGGDDNGEASDDDCDTVDDTELNEEWSHGTCECRECRLMRYAYPLFDSWQPTTDIERVVREAVMSQGVE